MSNKSVSSWDGIYQEIYPEYSWDELPMTQVFNLALKKMHFETFMRWVTHDTGPSNLALQEETLLWQQYTGVSPYSS